MQEAAGATIWARGPGHRADTVLRHNSVDTCGIIYLPPARRSRPRRNSSISAARAARSSGRRNDLPAAVLVNTSGSSTFVHDASSERSRPWASWNMTRSSPQFCLRVASTKRRPRHGWNGCVTSISMGARASPRTAVLDLKEGQGRGRGPGGAALDRGAAAPPAVLLARRAERGDPRTGRPAQRPRHPPSRRQPAAAVRGPRAAGAQAAACGALRLRAVAGAHRSGSTTMSRSTAITTQCRAGSCARKSGRV